jgi:hypothetical protein
MGVGLIVPPGVSTCFDTVCQIGDGGYKSRLGDSVTRATSVFILRQPRKAYVGVVHVFVSGTSTSPSGSVRIYERIDHGPASL